MSQATTLYRFYDVDGRVLYIGIAMGVHCRWARHAQEKRWWQEVASARLEHFPTREAATEAERAAIADEEPVYNVLLNKGPHRRRSKAGVGVNMGIPGPLHRQAKAMAARQGVPLYEYLAATIEREVLADDA